MTTISKLNSGLVIIAIVSSFWASPPDPKAQETAPPLPEELAFKLLTIQDNSLVANSSLPSFKITRRVNVMATAYSSTVWETDEDPHTTA
ncbi:MAG: hypothetical protein Q8Q91_03215, partial [Candidatus Daviesbacteria bacterium]|nr:hypothetical protein [Candidatus Daviesbacteria bacterium]